MRIENVGNSGSVGIDIVISENRGRAEARAQLGQQGGARFGSAGGTFCVVEPAMKYGNGNEVAGQDNQIRIQVIDDVDGGFDGHDRGMVVVKIAELRDGKAVKSSGQP